MRSSTRSNAERSRTRTIPTTERPGSRGEEPGDAATRAEIVTKLVHEVRGPVATLRGLVSTAIAHHDGLSDEERREFLELIRHEAERLEAAVEQVATALRLDAGTLSVEPGRHDLAEVIRAAALGVDAGPHPVELDIPGSLEASIDPRLVTILVQQLVRNAAAYSPPEEPIAVSLRRETSDALLEVVDRGPGIPTDRREDVFERFAGWRPAGYEPVPGAGLGLFISRAIAEGHGGSISIADGPTGGTMLAVRLPVEGAWHGP